MNPACLHGYGLCCRMSNPNPDDDNTSGSNIVNPLTQDVRDSTRDSNRQSTPWRKLPLPPLLRKQQQQTQHHLLVRERNLLLRPLITTL